MSEADPPAAAAACGAGGLQANFTPAPPPGKPTGQKAPRRFRSGSTSSLGGGDAGSVELQAQLLALKTRQLETPSLPTEKPAIPVPGVSRPELQAQLLTLKMQLETPSAPTEKSGIPVPVPAAPREAATLQAAGVESKPIAAAGLGSIAGATGVRQPSTASDAPESQAAEVEAVLQLPAQDTEQEDRSATLSAGQPDLQVGGVKDLCSAPGRATASRPSAPCPDPVLASSPEIEEPTKLDSAVPSADRPRDSGSPDNEGPTSCDTVASSPEHAPSSMEKHMDVSEETAAATLRSQAEADACVTVTSGVDNTRPDVAASLPISGDRGFKDTLSSHPDAEAACAKVVAAVGSADADADTRPPSSVGDILMSAESVASEFGSERSRVDETVAGPSFGLGDSRPESAQVVTPSEAEAASNAPAREASLSSAARRQPAAPCKRPPAALPSKTLRILEDGLTLAKALGRRGKQEESMAQYRRTLAICATLLQDTSQGDGLRSLTPFARQIGDRKPRSSADASRQSRELASHTEYAVRRVRERCSVVDAAP
eukprot:TRINITY_DN31505_c0_g2_i1.p1 TRINITY_DN31505_c0_g2~~TRINITY_DN31505_c0_g2_i1.p1  ORF type:complete len:544 (-),score=116.49 TRINITY_DN31505_c0_g2_i1:190-1821(-)